MMSKMVVVEKSGSIFFFLVYVVPAHYDVGNSENKSDYQWSSTKRTKTQNNDADERRQLLKYTEAHGQTQQLDGRQLLEGHIPLQHSPKNIGDIPITLEYKPQGEKQNIVLSSLIGDQNRHYSQLLLLDSRKWMCISTSTSTFQRQLLVKRS